jgi:hypothetical protein
LIKHPWADVSLGQLPNRKLNILQITRYFMGIGSEIERIVSTLNECDVRYLVVGGIAVNLHGRIRNTGDIDIIVDLNKNNLQNLEKALSDLDYVPRQPIKLTDAANPDVRKKWLEEKGAVALFFQNSRSPFISLDILYATDISFNEAYDRRIEMPLQNSAYIKVCSLDDLIHLKEISPRIVDQEDLRALRIIKASMEEEK